MMKPDLVVQILGMFGDGKPHLREEAYPALGFLDKRFTPKFCEKTVKRYLQYGLLRGRLDGEIKGYQYLEITDKGKDCLDYYRNMHFRDPREGVLF